MVCQLAYPTLEGKERADTEVKFQDSKSCFQLDISSRSSIVPSTYVLSSRFLQGGFVDAP
jgi:hypothetical protein